VLEENKGDEQTDYPGEHAYYIDSKGNVSEFGKKDLIFMADIFTKDDDGHVYAEEYLKKYEQWLSPGETTWLSSFNSFANNIALLELINKHTVTVDLETGKILDVSKLGSDPMAFWTQEMTPHNDGNKFYKKNDGTFVMSSGVPLRLFVYSDSGKRRIGVVIYSLESSIRSYEDFKGEHVWAVVSNGGDTSLLSEKEWRGLIDNKKYTYVLEEDTPVYYRRDGRKMINEIIPKGKLVTANPAYLKNSKYYLGEESWFGLSVDKFKNPIAIVEERTDTEKVRKISYGKIQKLNSSISITDKKVIEDILRSEYTRIIPQGYFVRMDFGNGMEKTIGPGSIITWDKEYATAVEDADGIETIVPAIIEVYPRLMDEKKQALLSVTELGTAKESVAKDGIPFVVETASLPPATPEKPKEKASLVEVRAPGSTLLAKWQTFMQEMAEKNVFRAQDMTTINGFRLALNKGDISKKTVSIHKDFQKMVMDTIELGKTSAIAQKNRGDAVTEFNQIMAIGTEKIDKDTSLKYDMDIIIKQNIIWYSESIAWLDKQIKEAEGYIEQDTNNAQAWEDRDPSKIVGDDALKAQAEAIFYADENAVPISQDEQNIAAVQAGDWENITDDYWLGKHLEDVMKGGDQAAIDAFKEETVASLNSRIQENQARKDYINAKPASLLEQAAENEDKKEDLEARYGRLADIPDTSWYGHPDMEFKDRINACKNWASAIAAEQILQAKEALEDAEANLTNANENLENAKKNREELKEEIKKAAADLVALKDKKKEMQKNLAKLEKKLAEAKVFLIKMKYNLREGVKALKVMYEDLAILEEKLVEAEAWLIKMIADGHPESALKLHREYIQSIKDAIETKKNEISDKTEELDELRTKKIPDHEAYIAGLEVNKVDLIEYIKKLEKDVITQKKYIDKLLYETTPELEKYIKELEKTVVDATEALEKAKTDAANAEEVSNAKKDATISLADDIAQYASAKSEMLDNLTAVNDKAIEMARANRRLLKLRRDVLDKGRTILEEEKPIKYLMLEENRKAFREAISKSSMSDEGKRKNLEVFDAFCQSIDVFFSPMSSMIFTEKQLDTMIANAERQILDPDGAKYLMTLYNAASNKNTGNLVTLPTALKLLNQNISVTAGTIAIDQGKSSWFRGVGIDGNIADNLYNNFLIMRVDSESFKYIGPPSGDKDDASNYKKDEARKYILADRFYYDVAGNLHISGSGYFTCPDKVPDGEDKDAYKSWAASTRLVWDMDEEKRWHLVIDAAHLEAAKGGVADLIAHDANGNEIKLPTKINVDESLTKASLGIELTGKDGNKEDGYIFFGILGENEVSKWTPEGWQIYASMHGKMTFAKMITVQGGIDAGPENIRGGAGFSLNLPWAVFDTYYNIDQYNESISARLKAPIPTTGFDVVLNAIRYMKGGGI
ncbi:MAG: hypothetical protein RAP41_05225, partial [Candidatus Orphnella occulta]|nr:hypothetical protein [Candidatus Orphnella occulta]